jgi:30S ribosomal protein 3
MERFILKFLWLDKTIAVCVDQKVGTKSIPLTEYFFWPQRDAWEDTKLFLESKEWIMKSEVIALLNIVTEVINYWQERDSLVKKDIDKLRNRFPNVIFIGFD